MMRKRGLTAGAFALAAAVVGCGVPSGDDTFERIEDVDVPLNLAAESTTTTTTTTTTVVDSQESTTTTMPDVQPEIDLQPVSLFFITRDELRSVTREIDTGFTPRELIELLAVVPDPDTSPGLETAVSEGLVLDIIVSAGVATVDLDEALFDEIPNSEQTLMFAQIVLTLTERASRLGTVEFTFDGEPGNAQIPNNLFPSTVTYDDYAPLVASADATPPPTSTTTTTTAPTTTTVETTVPETTVPVDSGSDEITDATTAPATTAG